MRRRLLVLALLVLLSVSARADSGFPFVSAATTNCQVVQAGYHFLTGMTMANNGSAAYAKFYDMATTPTAGATQGASPGGAPYVFGIPGATALAGSNTYQVNLLFSSGIAMCMTGGAANNDTTALSASQVVGTITWR